LDVFSQETNLAPRKRGLFLGAGFFLAPDFSWRRIFLGAGFFLAQGVAEDSLFKMPAELEQIRRSSRGQQIDILREADIPFGARVHAHLDRALILQ
jgi:hypothetical protein